MSQPLSPSGCGADQIDAHEALGLSEADGASMSRCDCLECSYRRRHLDDKLDQDDMRLVLAMVALSRVMYWVALQAEWNENYGYSDRFKDYGFIESYLESGYFRLVYGP